MIELEIQLAKSKKLKKEEDLKKFREEFADKGIVKSIYGAVEQKVKCACQNTENLLADKRSR